MDFESHEMLDHVGSMLNLFRLSSMSRGTVLLTEGKMIRGLQVISRGREKRLLFAVLPSTCAWVFWAHALLYTQTRPSVYT